MSFFAILKKILSGLMRFAICFVIWLVLVFGLTAAETIGAFSGAGTRSTDPGRRMLAVLIPSAVSPWISGLLWCVAVSLLWGLIKLALRWIRRGRRKAVSGG